MSKRIWFSGSMRFLFSTLAILCLASVLNAESMSITVDIDNHRIVQNGEYRSIEVPGYRLTSEPGKPKLPAKNVMIGLPPGARVTSVDIEGVGKTELPETYRIEPASPILPLFDPDMYPLYFEKANRDWQRSYESAYSTDLPYPAQPGKLAGSGSLRKYAYASVTIYPFCYHPESGRLERYSSVIITVNYDLPIPGSEEAIRVERLINDTSADDRASELFINYDQIRGLYSPDNPTPEEPLTVYDYVIITTSNLRYAVESSDFIDWKTSLGFGVRTVLTSDPEIAAQPGIDLAEKIRNFLRENYSEWGIEYVLLVGNYTAIPMRYCYPDSNNHSNGAGDPSNWPWAGDVPTDYYYADLTDPDILSWDSDCDGFHGEYGQDNPDMLAEVFVGRIPTNNTYRITYALDKLVSFEEDTGAWKNNILQAGAIAYYRNDDHSGRDLIDGAELLDQMERDYMGGYAISHYSEQDGLAPSEMEWPGLSESSFIGAWRSGRYAVVNWYAHGWSSYVARKVWSWDDGDGVPESNEMSWPGFAGISSNLDDDYPSIVFALSCVVGYPEPNNWGNFGIDLLTRPSWGASIGVVSGTRVVWVSTGGGELHSYEFNRYLLDGPQGPEKIGQALYDSKAYLSQNYFWNHYAEYWDQFTFNLYGDPSLAREGAQPTSADESPIPIPELVSLEQNYPNPFNPSTTISYDLPGQSDVRIEIYNILGQKTARLFAGNQPAGHHTIAWRAENVPSGIYFARLETDGWSESIKMMLLK